MIGYEEIKELVESELSDFSYFKLNKIEFEEEFGNHNYFAVDIVNLEEKKKTLNFRYDVEKKIIEIELNEDCYQELDDYTYKARYFWMALLEWW